MSAHCLILGLLFVISNNERPLSFIQIKDQVYFCGSYAGDRSVKNSIHGNLCLQNIRTGKLYLPFYQTGFIPDRTAIAPDNPEAYPPEKNLRIHFGFDGTNLYFTSPSFQYNEKQGHLLNMPGLGRYEISKLNKEFSVPPIDFNSTIKIRDKDINSYLYLDKPKILHSAKVYYPLGIDRSVVESLPTDICIMPHNSIYFYIKDLNRIKQYESEKDVITPDREWRQTRMIPLNVDDHFYVYQTTRNALSARFEQAVLLHRADWRRGDGQEDIQARLPGEDRLLRQDHRHHWQQPELSPG
jgi:hypothetical protein